MVSVKVIGAAGAGGILVFAILLLARYYGPVRYQFSLQQQSRKEETIDEWYNESKRLLRKIEHKGSHIRIQENPQISYLEDINDIAEELDAHAESTPDSVPEEVEDTVIDVALAAGPASQLVKDLYVVGSFEELTIRLQAFREHLLGNSDVEFDEIGSFERLENAAVDFQKIVGEFMNENPEMVPLIADALVDDIDELQDLKIESAKDMEELPWKKIDSALPRDMREEMISRILEGVLMTYLIGLPQEAIEKIEEEQ